MSHCALLELRAKILLLHWLDCLVLHQLDEEFPGALCHRTITYCTMCNCAKHVLLCWDVAAIYICRCEDSWVGWFWCVKTPKCVTLWRQLFVLHWNTLFYIEILCVTLLLYWNTLCYIVLHWNTLCYIVLHCVIFYYIFYIVLHFLIFCDNVIGSVTFCYIVLHLGGDICCCQGSVLHWLLWLEEFRERLGNFSMRKPQLTPGPHHWCHHHHHRHHHHRHHHHHHRHHPLYHDMPIQMEGWLSLPCQGT